MSFSENTELLEWLGTPRVVGTIPCRSALEVALKVAPERVDVMELRLDGLLAEGGLDRGDYRKLARLSDRHPLLLTVRHPEEGGAIPTMDAGSRLHWYREFLPAAALIDVEARSLRGTKGEVFGELVAEARSEGRGVVISAHDFEGTPGSARMRALGRFAMERGADVFKLAVRLRTAADFSRLVELGGTALGRGVLSLMGMGAEFGRVSRLAMAAVGSALNYGFLDPESRVEGQWAAVDFKDRLREVLGQAAK
jgi:3-dehydroquinate dehydratase-1